MEVKSTLGWNKYFSTSFTKNKLKDSIPARIISEHRDSYTANTGKAEVRAQLSGKLIHTLEDSERPKVGDWVVATWANDELLIIHSILERQNKLSRKAAGTKLQEQVFAANIDLMFVVMGLDQDFNINRLERYLALAANNKIQTIIVCNKVDVCEDQEDVRDKIRETAKNKEVLLISAKENLGIAGLAEHFKPNKTGILLGSSGVGKSTMINRLLSKDIQQVREVRKDDSKGRHVTSVRQLFLLPGGGCLIDTPGMRELALWDEQSNLESSFSDIAELAVHCKFRNCTHSSEKGCAVQKAIAAGDLSQKRYQNYLKMKKELEYLHSKKSKKAKYEYKQKQKKLYQGYAQILRTKQKNKP